MQTEAELYADVFLACDMLNSSGLLSGGISSAMIDQILTHTFQDRGKQDFYQVSCYLPDLNRNLTCSGDIQPRICITSTEICYEDALCVQICG